MKVVAIDRNTLLDGILLPVIVERAFKSLPAALQKIYINSKTQHKQLEVGLDLKLGFYIIDRLSGYEIKLLWWENQHLRPQGVAIESLPNDLDKSWND